MSSFDFMNVCRLCLAKDGHLHPIFGGESEVPTISLKITSCLPVKIAREDKLPQKICEQCLYKLDLSYEFWNLTVETEKQLLQWLSGVNSQNYAVTTILNQDIMKGEQSNENRLDGSMMQQVSGHQNSMNMGIDNMCISMIMPNNNQQQITSVPIDTSGSSVQNVQVIAGSSTQTTHDQITQSQTNVSTQQEEEEESSEDEENSDDECDGDEGLPIKEESEEDPNNSRTIEPTTFVNVSLHCDEAGPSGIRQQKITDIQEMTQATDVDPKTGDSSKIEEVDEEYYTSTLPYVLDKSPRKMLDHLENLDDPLEITDIKQEWTQDLWYQAEQCNYFRKSIQNIVFSEHRSTFVTYHLETQDVTSRIIAENRPEDLWKCFLCDINFRCKLDSEKYRNTSHNYSCKICNTFFIQQTELRDHMKRNHKPFRKYSCDKCPYETTKRNNFIQHTKYKHYSRSNTCKLCNKNCKWKSSLTRHMTTIHNNTQPKICEACGRFFKHKWTQEI